MDYKALVEQANLSYQGTVKRCEEGLPIGNGRMGSMLWTSPASLKMQINRVDLYANGNQTNSFIDCHEDYGYACAFVDVDFSGFGPDVFDETTRQELNVYDARAKLNAHGLQVEGFAADDVDAFALRIEDGRAAPEGIEIRLRMLRNSVVRTRSHVAYSTLHRVNGMAVLKQEFFEDDFYCASAVAVKVVGRNGYLRIDNENNGTAPTLPPQHISAIGREAETQAKLMLKPEKGAFLLYIASAATFDRDCDVVKMAADAANQADGTGYDALYAAHIAWWHKFWEKSYVRLWGSPDAEKISVHYTYFFYIMASCSRNSEYAPNFGGLLFSPRGDHRHWGAMQWWNNLNLTYNAILPSGHNELLEPYFKMFFNMYESSEVAADQIWGAKGIYIGETTYVWGPEKLPEDIAEELRELMLMRKPWAERSQAFRDFASGKNPFEPRWNFLVGESTDTQWVRGQLKFNDTPYGPIAHVSHIFSSMACLAYHYWLYYEYTKDVEFLRDIAYPMLRGVTEFFATYPNLVKEADGKYHILYSNTGESFWGAKDTLGSLTAIHGLFPTAIHAAGLLHADKDRVPVWQEILNNIAPLPTSRDTEAGVKIPEDGSEIWVGSRGKPLCRAHNAVKPEPCVYFDQCNAQTAEVNPALYQIGQNTLRSNMENAGAATRWLSSEMSAYPRIFAAMGRGDILCDNIIRQLNSETAANEHCFFVENGAQAVYQNRLTAREGINAISAQRLGNAAAGLQMGLLQCSGGAPTLQPVVRIFPAWNSEWNAEFELWSRGGFKISSSFENGATQFVRAAATREDRLVIMNPWAGERVKAVLGGTASELSGSKFEFAMKPGDELILTRIDD